MQKREAKGIKGMFKVISRKQTENVIPCHNKRQQKCKLFVLTLSLFKTSVPRVTIDV